VNAKLLGVCDVDRVALAAYVPDALRRADFSSDSDIGMNKFHDSFQLMWHGNTVVIVPAADIESMRWDLIDQAAEIVMGPIKEMSVPMVVFDLSEVNYFGSVFLALLLRCHKLAKSRGGELVLCGASKTASELLRLTALDTLWAIYSTREEALAALNG
jgi:anti-anti-sigma factor